MIKHAFLIAIFLLISFASHAGVVGGRRLFKFESGKDFAPFRFTNAKWNSAVGGVEAEFGSEGNENDKVFTCSAVVNPYPSALIESPDVEIGFPCSEIVVSWNAITPPGSYLRVYIQARSAGIWSKRFTVAIWSRESRADLRTSLKLQKDMFARMESDTLFLTKPADAFRVSAELSTMNGRTYPVLKVLTVHALGKDACSARLRKHREVWGKDLSVPERSQLTVPEGNRFCSATSTAMVLDWWAQKLCRPELSVPLQTAVDSIYDPGWGGTGNWTFNTAYAAELGGLKAYVTRLSSISQIEQWIAKDVPVIVSVDYNVLRGRTGRRMGHLMVIRGFTEDGDPIFNDPYTFIDRGECVRKIFSRSNFEASWLTEEGSRGTVYLIYPDGWDIPKNSYLDW
ncbi:MAG: peptidase C39 family protein [Armatimonadota bacterium]|nr:peptidase C39 family protein [Armatimonadota bacterium]